MADYDIGEAFRSIEHELIASMTRNLSRHQAEELEQGYEWAQWQVMQLEALEEYRRRNASRMPAQFERINDRIEQELKTSYNTAQAAQERQILSRVRNNIPEPIAAQTGTGAIQGEFFKTNDRKLNALINATTNDMQKAEYAVLRMTNDKYRSIIFNAQVYANTGAGTYEKAVDMATRDFLSAGINCIEYKDGRRVNIRSYAEMALRTANKRAYLQGEGEMRKKWGIHTVILNKRTNACPKCAPFAGKIIVDDVWSGGTAEEAAEKGYLLMSECIKAGLYHPNCQDSHTTYFDDILAEEERLEREEAAQGEDQTEAQQGNTPQRAITSRNDELLQSYTPQEQERNIELYNAEQRENYCERQVQRFERLEEFSLDPDNQREYRARKTEWKSKLADVKKTVARLKKDVAIAAESGIIESGSGVVTLENQRYGRNKNTLVNKTYIDSGDYRRKFDNATDNSAVNKTLYDCAKAALKHRSGTKLEDMYWIDGNTGKIMLAVTDSTEERAIIYTDKIRNIISGSRNMVTIHTHPSSMPPSASDLNSCFNNNYKVGFVACHNGKVFGYTSNEPINERIYDLYIQNYIKEGYSEFDAQLKALEKLSLALDIEIWEVTSNE